jgi:antitoxin (DNA-binding transcriptional repressor) of toxin-antitoxin stability system
MTLTLAEVQARLPELVHDLKPGEEVVITEHNRPVAKLVATPSERPRPVPGRGKEMLTILAEDHEHLEAFKEYMP